ncbi:MAG: protein O-mannosyl-transferase family [Bacteroidota bacterium]
MVTKFKKYNLILGWASFVIASAVYLLTLEPTVSLWDCGEFISSSYKLQIGHPPGAPLFMLMARFFSLFAGSADQVARWINSMSALVSGLTIMFLFWTISHLLRKFMMKKEEEETLSNMLVVLGGAFVGAMAYTFSDTFWFSAVEGEVYASSSLFTAVVFWAILKWENVADESRSNRWLILIAYLMGLSIGVHLLNLLAIPAIVLVYYFKKYEVTRKGLIKAVALSFLILAGIMYGIIPGVVKIASWFEYFFTNMVGLHFNTGFLIYMVILLGALAYGIYHSQFVKKRVVLNTFLVSTTMIIIGYSTFALIVIRSLADPPMNENRPQHVFSLLSYLNREQYGDRPLFFGHQYNDEIKEVVYKKPVIVLNQETGKYEEAYKKPELEYSGHKILFPRMYSREGSHKSAYYTYGSIKDKNNPSYLDNLEFMVRYQFGFMYFRYFMWNFVGKQNDSQANGNILEGNWISGIPFMDNVRLGNQSALPDRWKNDPARNRYFFLPLLLGLIGLFFHAEKHPRDFWVVMALFVMTGIAIVFYLNQTPNQPRERDYAYAGSFYAFAIWIGIGVAGVYSIIQARLKSMPAALVAVVLSFICVPALMARENWDDHDRSGRYTTRDIARNYLESCEKDAILFTNGDNDTFPLWYAQEVEGIRTDVRIVNLMLFNTDWYIDQMKKKAYESAPLPISLPWEKYKEGTNNSIYIRKNERWAPLDYIITFVNSDDPRTKLKLRSGQDIDFIPTHRFILPVDSATVLSNGTVKPGNADELVKEIRFELTPDDQVMKGTLAELDLLATNHWKRPIYFVAGGNEGALGLEGYFQLEGLAYRLVPIQTPEKSILEFGRIDTDILYDKLMNTFTWGHMDDPDVYLDYYHVRTLNVIRFRNVYTRLAVALVKEGKNEKAAEVLDRCMELAPKNKLPYDRNIGGITFPDDKGGFVHHEGIIEAYYLCGQTEKANALLRDYYNDLAQEFSFYNSLKPRLQYTVQQESYNVLSQMEELKMLITAYHQDDLALELGLR